MISNKSMTIDEIIFFIYNQDIYYHEFKYKNSNLRDPIIFQYIDITGKDKNFLINIEKLKNKKIWELFNDSYEDIKKKFYFSFCLK